MVSAAASLDIKRSPDAVQLRQLVGRLRLRLGLERTLKWSLRGLAVSAATFIAISIAEWLTGESVAYWPAALPSIAAVAVALVRWPSRSEAARDGDRRLGLAERLATAIELTQRGGRGRFDTLQLRDAVHVARNARGSKGLHVDRRTPGLALVLVTLAAASVALQNVPRPSFPASDDQQMAMLDLTEADGLARAEAPELSALSLAWDAQPNEQQPQVDSDLASRVELEQAERDALDRLSQALGKVSAAQAAADAIQRGDFASAKDLLASLGDEADQLSDAAKQQLARALQQAANATASTDKALADRERQAATALGRNNYNEQRQALRNLGDQVEKSGARTSTSDQLARDVGRLQQQAAATQQGQGAPGQQNTAASPSAAPATASQAPAADGGANTEGALGQQGGPGIGTGPGGDPTGDQTNRLETSGQSVEVPTKLGTGAGVRPADGTEDQLGNNPTASNRAVSELIQTQHTGQVTPEQNLVPGEQRPVVRGYFH